MAIIEAPTMSVEILASKSEGPALGPDEQDVISPVVEEQDEEYGRKLFEPLREKPVMDLGRECVVKQRYLDEGKKIHDQIFAIVLYSAPALANS